MPESIRNKVFRKSQMFTLDLSLAAMVFISIIIAASFLWQNASENITLHQTRTEMESMSLTALASLLDTEEGLVEERLVINSTKLDAFMVLDHNSSGRRLGITGPGYNHFITISTWNGTGYSLWRSSGHAMNSTAQEVTLHRRYAIINDTRAELQIFIWKSCEQPDC